MKNVLCNALLLLGLTSNVMVQPSRIHFLENTKPRLKRLLLIRSRRNIMNRHSSEVLLS